MAHQNQKPFKKVNLTREVRKSCPKDLKCSDVVQNSSFSFVAFASIYNRSGLSLSQALGTSICVSIAPSDIFLKFKRPLFPHFDL